MKLFEQLSKDIEELTNNISKELEKEQRKTAEKIWQDVIENAPYKNGNYIASINIDETTIKNGVIKTFIGSNMLLEPTKWTGGKRYNLGYLLEHGTLNHAIPNAFDKGIYYGYIGEDERYHKGTLDDDWHPGSIAIPHYKLALEKNKELYKGKIKLAFKKGVKQ